MCLASQTLSVRLGKGACIGLLRDALLQVGQPLRVAANPPEDIRQRPLPILYIPNGRLPHNILVKKQVNNNSFYQAREPLKRAPGRPPAKINQQYVLGSPEPCPFFAVPTTPLKSLSSSTS